MNLLKCTGASAIVVVGVLAGGLLSGCVVGEGSGYYSSGRGYYGGIDIDVAPPPDRVYVAPPRVGYIYAPGYWRWSGRNHVWVDGHYMRERRGYHWKPDRWERRGNRYHYERGHWER